MDNKEEFKEVLESFLAKASKEDILELEAYLSKLDNLSRQTKEQPVKAKQATGRVDAHKMAKSFASSFQERMGLTPKNIQNTARNAVRTMILQYDPFIPENQIDALLDKFIPNMSNQWKKISPETMRAMIAQYVSYGRGELAEAQLKSFPEGWAKKYWSNFPPKIQVLIKGYIEDKISNTDFWNFVESVLVS